MPKLKLATFVVTEAHIAPFREVAAAQGLSASALLRTLISKEIRRASKEDGALVPAAKRRVG